MVCVYLDFVQSRTSNMRRQRPPRKAKAPRILWCCLAAGLARHLVWCPHTSHFQVALNFEKVTKRHGGCEKHRSQAPRESKVQKVEG